MKKLLLFLFILLIPLSLNKEIKVKIQHNQIRHEIYQDKGKEAHYNFISFHIDEYYMKNYIFYSESEPVFYLRTKAKALFRVDHKVKNSIYLYHSIRKLGRT